MIQRTVVPAIFISVILLFFSYFLFFSVNFPFQDDFLIIQFIETILKDKPDFFGFIKELFRTFNDHKAVIPRLIGFLNYEVSGSLNFRFYLLLVQINTIYIFYFLYLQFKKTGLSFYYFLPTAFIYFQPIYYDISAWALNGMQHTFLTAFTVSAILLASRRTNWGMYMAVVCCFLATFTHGNGLFSFPAIIFCYFCYKDFRKAIASSIFMFISLGIYILTYETGQAMQPPKSIGSFLVAFLSFVGGATSLWGNITFWCALTGGIILALIFPIAMRVFKSLFNKSIQVKAGTIELLSFLVFILITASVIAFFRSWMGSIVDSRFLIYASITPVICYILVLNYMPSVRKRSFYIPILGLSIFYWAYSYYHSTNLVAFKKTAYLADVYNWREHKRMFVVSRGLIANADFYLTPAYEKGIFKLPEPVISSKKLNELYASTTPSTIDYKMYLDSAMIGEGPNANDEYDRYHFIMSDTLPKAKSFLSDRFFVLRDAKNGKTYLKSANPKVQSRKNILLKREYYHGGFSPLFRPNDFDEGEYELAVMDVELNGEETFYRLDKRLNVTNKVFTLK